MNQIQVNELNYFNYSQLILDNIDLNKIELLKK